MNIPSEEFYKTMSKRRSIRQFSSEPVDKEIIINAIKTAGSAPSGANRQPWFFALITSQETKEKIRQAAERIEYDFYNQKAPQTWLNDLKVFGTNSSKPYLSEAPALIAVFSRTNHEVDGNLIRTYYPIESTGIATGFLLAALHTSGLSTLTHTPKPMFFLNDVLNLDKTYRPFMIVVTGHPKPTLNLTQIERKPLLEIFDEY